MNGTMEWAVLRALGQVNDALEQITGAEPGDWTGSAANAYEARRAELASSVSVAGGAVESILPAARAADAEAATWRAVSGVVA